MKKNLKKGIATKLLILVLSYLFFINTLINYSLIAKAEKVEQLPACSGDKCLSNFSDVSISSDGSFFVLIDSAGIPYIRKVDFSSNSFMEGPLVQLLNEDNVTKRSLYTLGLSQSKKKAFAHKIINPVEKEITVKNFDVNLHAQTNKETDCKCKEGEFFTGLNCLKSNLTLSCEGTKIDPVCSCDNITYVNNCVAKSNGVKQFSNGTCDANNKEIECSFFVHCPVAKCSNGNTYIKYNCVNRECEPILFTSDPCTTSSSSSSSGVIEGCQCKPGEYFNSLICVSGELSCKDQTSNLVCGCDKKNYLSACVANANGIQKFTGGACGPDEEITCSSDSQCPIGKCKDGTSFNKFKCTDNLCVLIEFSKDPCVSSSGGNIDVEVESEGKVHVIDLDSKQVNAFAPVTTTGKVTTISTIAFLDKEGNKLIGSDSDASFPQLLILNAKTGKSEKDLLSPDILKSIEFTPDLEKAVTTFKKSFLQSIGFFTSKTKEFTKVDLPSSIFFDVDEFTGKARFDLFSKKGVLSSLGGKHVLHLLDLNKNKLVVKFLNETEIEGETISAISPDNQIVVSAGNNLNNKGIQVYKLNVSKIETPKVLKTVAFDDVNSILDISITPDNNNVLLLVKKQNEKKLKILQLKSLSLICEINISKDLESKLLLSDPYGRYLVVPDFKANSVNLITDLYNGPVLRDISFNVLKDKKKTTNFVIDGFINSLVFDTSKLKVCFNKLNVCAKNPVISSDGKRITGQVPIKLKSKPYNLFLSAPKKNVNLSVGQCTQIINTKSEYKNISKFPE